jgi:predicted ATPase/DNA-binding winged helix-turn-helix (wHTH) protein
MSHPLFIPLSHCLIDTRQQVVNKEGASERLTTKEMQLLLYLCAHPGRTIPREELLVEVWGYDPSSQTRAADNMVKKVRAKVEHNPKKPVHIHTVHGEGYRFEPFVEATLKPHSAPAEAQVTSRVNKTNLGTEWNRFYGRSQERERLLRLLSKGRALVTLTGPAGTGKSRLAALVGQKLYETAVFPRVLWVDLAEVSDGEGLLTQVYAELQVDEVSVQTPEHLGRFLAGQGSQLLILDNVEQIPGPTRSLLLELRQSAPDTAFLLTSQHRLKAPGERNVPVGPLTPKAARELFIARASSSGALKDDETLNEALVDTIITHLEGLPLAIELAASRVDLMGLRGLSERLARHLDALTQQSTSGKTRHSSLRAAFNNSWELLSPDEQRALCLCATFEGGFSLEAAEALCSADPELDTPPLSLIHSLIDKSMIDVRRRGQGSRRMFLLNTIRTYAREQAQSHGWVDSARSLQMKWAAETAEAAFHNWDDDLLVLERANLSAAIAWANQRQSPHLCELSLGASRSASTTHAITKAMAQLNEAITLHGHAEGVVRYCYVELAKHLGRRGQFSEALSTLSQARERLPDQGSALLKARIDLVEAEVSLKRGDKINTHLLFEKAAKTLRGHTDAPISALTLTNLAFLHIQRGNPKKALTILMSVESNGIAQFSRTLRAQILTISAQVQYESGHPRVAVEKITDAIAIISEGTVSHIKLLSYLGRFQAALGNMDASDQANQQARELAKKKLSPVVEAFILDAVIDSLLRREHFGEALALSESGAKTYKRYKVVVSAGMCKYTAGHALIGMGQPKRAATRYEEGLSLFNEQAPREAALGCLYYAIASSQHDASAAEVLFERGDSLLPRPGLFGDNLLIELTKLAVMLGKVASLEPSEAESEHQAVADALGHIQKQREYTTVSQITLFTNFLSNVLQGALRQ